MVERWLERLEKVYESVGRVFESPWARQFLFHQNQKAVRSDPKDAGPRSD